MQSTCRYPGFLQSWDSDQWPMQTSIDNKKESNNRKINVVPQVQMSKVKARSQKHQGSSQRIEPQWVKQWEWKANRQIKNWRCPWVSTNHPLRYGNQQTLANVRGAAWARPWFQPLWKIYQSQWGWWNSHHMWKNNMLQSSNELPSGKRLHSHGNSRYIHRQINYVY